MTPGSTTSTDIDERTADLFRRLRAAPDEATRERCRVEITELYLPAARRVAARYAGHGEAFDDLYQVACYALVKAVRGFDPDRGTPFGAYATPSMHGEVKRHFRDHVWMVRPPRRILDTRGRVNEVAVSLTQDLHRTPSVTEISDAAGLDAGTVRDCLASNDLYRPTSLDGPSAGEEEAPATEPAVLGRPDDRLESVLDRLTLAQLLTRLAPRERRLLALRFGDDRTQSQIAVDLGISQVQVSRLLTKALATLRSGMTRAEAA
jgi:RNA polymerase sigma-B factor